MRARLGDWKRRLHPRWIGVRRWALDRVWPVGAQARVVDSDPASNVAIVRAPAALEPHWGYAVHGRLGVIDRSLPGVMPTLRNPATRHLFAGLPSFAHLLRRKHVERVSGTPLSLRNRSDSNYYHATIECFGALAAYVEADLLDGNTLVIGKGLAGTPIWSEFEQLGGLRSISHVVQRSAWIVGDGEVAFVDLPRVDGTWTDVDGPITISEVTPSSLRRTRALLESVLPPRSDAPDVHLYVVRGASDGRQLRNADEVADFFRARGFELVDPGTMSWTQQVELFRRAARVAGVHGAALTNVLYRWPERMQLLEIAEPGRVAQYFRNIACALEYEYAEVTGTRGEGRVRRQTFEVDVDAIARVLDAWDRPTR